MKESQLQIFAFVKEGMEYNQIRGGDNLLVMGSNLEL